MMTFSDWKMASAEPLNHSRPRRCCAGRLHVLIEHRRQPPAARDVAVERIAHVLGQDFDFENQS